MVDQRLGVALYLGVNQADVNVFLEEIVRKQLDSLRCDFEWFAQIALQGVDARAATVEVAFHLSEEGLQLKIVFGFLQGITVVDGGHQGTRAAQAIARRHVGGKKEAVIQVFLQRLKIKEA